MKLYAKESAVSLIRSMIRRDRLSHAYIICGEKGVGKKTLGRYMAAQILCEKGDGDPCGVCKSCRMLKNDAHPDFITIEPSGKSGNYRADDLRAIISEASIAPNEGEKKIYFLPRFDKALPTAQNALLKIVEEPPAHVLFIMTAESREMILPTILSRTISLSISEAEVAECLEALTDAGIQKDDAWKAVDMFGGNIGKCIEYVRDNDAKRLPESVKEAISALVNGDEYELLRSLCSLEKDRALCVEVLSDVKKVLRDALAHKFGGNLSSLCREDAKALSKKLRQSTIERMYDDITLAENKINGNASAVLVLSDLCGRLSIN